MLCSAAPTPQSTFGPSRLASGWDPHSEWLRSRSSRGRPTTSQRKRLLRVSAPRIPRSRHSNCRSDTPPPHQIASMRCPAGQTAGRCSTPGNRARRHRGQPRWSLRLWPNSTNSRRQATQTGGRSGRFRNRVRRQDGNIGMKSSWSESHSSRRDMSRYTPLPTGVGEPGCRFPAPLRSHR